MTDTTRRRRGRSVPFDKDRMRHRRIEVGLSQLHLAEITGLSTSLISALECGDCGPSPETLARLAAALDCRTTDLMRRETPDDGTADPSRRGA